MRVCLLSMEIFAWGKHGGYGRATRIIGRELVRRGVEVSAVVPLRGNQRPVEQLDGIHVLGFSPRTPWQAAKLIRECNAEIYHSQEPSFTTYLAQQKMPGQQAVRGQSAGPKSGASSPPGLLRGRVPPGQGATQVPIEVDAGIPADARISTSPGA
jgi:hypothetical protein